MTKGLRMLPLSICVILVNATMAAFQSPDGQRDGAGGFREPSAGLGPLAGGRSRSAARAAFRDSARRQLESRPG